MLGIFRYLQGIFGISDAAGRRAVGGKVGRLAETRLDSSTGKAELGKQQQGSSAAARDLQSQQGSLAGAGAQEQKPRQGAS